MPTPIQLSIWPSNQELLHNDLTRCLSFDATALAANRATLRNMVELGSIMMWWYCVDRTNLLGSGTKETRLRDLWVVFAVLTAVAAVTSIRQAKAPVLLNRQQTEEWKGWMQVGVWSGSGLCRMAANHTWFSTGAVFAISLLSNAPAVQCNPHIHCCVCMDDRIWQFCLLLQDQRLPPATVRNTMRCT